MGIQPRHVVHQICHERFAMVDGIPVRIAGKDMGGVANLLPTQCSDLAVGEEPGGVYVTSYVLHI